MRRLLASAALLFALLAAPALGGGWATTGLSPLPDGTAPGEPWVVDVTVLAHGRTPIDGMEPAVTISRGDVRRTFPARPRGDGVYRATVVFPGAGRWRYAVESGYGGPDATTFGTVTIAERQTASATTDGPRWPLALLAGVAAAAVARAVTRRRPRSRRAVTAA